jgi:hypothetical protein
LFVTAKGATIDLRTARPARSSAAIRGAGAPCANEKAGRGIPEAGFVSRAVAARKLQT